MAIMQDPAVLWFLAGLIFFILEFALPGFILFFFGIGAWITGIFSYFIPAEANLQWLIFIITSLVSIALLRKTLSGVKSRNLLSVAALEDEFLGKTAVTLTDITPGVKGKVEFKGTIWDAKSEETILPGQTVTIVGHESIVLIIKST